MLSIGSLGRAFKLLGEVISSDQPRGNRHVVYIHGFLAPSLGAKLAWQPIAQLTEARIGTISHYVELHRAGFSSMSRNVDALEQKIFEILRRYPDTEQIDLVGHSLGSLTAMHYLKRRGFANLIRRAILLGGPLNGTHAIDYGKFAFPLGTLMYALSPTMRHMAYKSPYINDLNSRPIPEGPEVHLIAAKHDRWLITPWDSAHHCETGVHKHIVEGGHLSMLFRSAVINTVSEILSAPPQPQLALIASAS